MRTPHKGRGRNAAPRKTEFIVGKRPVVELLRGSGRALEIKVCRDLDKDNLGRLIMSLAAKAGVKIHRVSTHAISDIAGGANHQGIAARALPYTYASIDTVIRAGSDGILPVLLLDGLTDPQNLGSLLRSAETLGCAGVIIPKARSAEITPAVVRISSGASEHMHIARHNLAAAIQRLQKAGYWVLGTDPESEDNLGDQPGDRALGVVVGSEEKGLSKLVRSRCDQIISLTTTGRVSSMNAAVAGALVLYELSRGRSGG